MDAARHLSTVSDTTVDSRPEARLTDTLPDQAELERTLARLIRQSRHKPVVATLALLQLANFFEIRTWVGKAEAALLLTDITGVLLKALPPSVVPCRCENYEFALLLHNECSHNADTITARVKSAIQTAASATIPPQLQLHCAVGLARITADIPQPEVLFARARHDLSQNDDPTGARPRPPQRHTLQLILKGLRRRGLRPNFQALVGLQPGTDSLFEVRSRLHTGAKLIEGSELFASAVPNALGEALDRISLHLSLQRLRADASLRLLVNLSLNSLVSSAFQTWLAGQVQQSAPLHNRLILQVSELDLLVAQHHMGTFDACLQSLDLPLSIAHFGCSKNALGYLPLLNVAFVKLDQSLTARLKPDSVPLQSLRRTVEELHNQNITVMATKVENLAMLPLLWQCGVDLMQGHCLQSPAETPVPYPLRHLEFRN